VFDAAEPKMLHAAYALDANDFSVIMIEIIQQFSI
jgi:hypothetical protein